MIVCKSNAWLFQCQTCVTFYLISFFCWVQYADMTMLQRVVLCGQQTSLRIGVERAASRHACRSVPSVSRKATTTDTTSTCSAVRPVALATAATHPSWKRLGEFFFHVIILELLGLNLPTILNDESKLTKALTLPLKLTVVDRLTDWTSSFL